MNIGKFLSIKIILIVLLLSTFDMSNKVLVGAETPTKEGVTGHQGVQFSFSLLAKLQMLRKYLRRLIKSPRSAHTASEIKRTQEEIKILEEMGKAEGGEGPQTPGAVPVPGVPTGVPEPIPGVPTEVPVPIPGVPTEVPAPQAPGDVPSELAALQVPVTDPETQVAVSEGVLHGPYFAGDLQASTPPTQDPDLARASRVPVTVPEPQIATSEILPGDAHGPHLADILVPSSSSVTTPESPPEFPSPSTPISGPEEGRTHEGPDVTGEKHLYPKGAYQEFWNRYFITGEPLLGTFLHFGHDPTEFQSNSVARDAYNRFLGAITNGVPDITDDIESVEECRILGARDLVFLKAFNYLLNQRLGTNIELKMLCLLFTNSLRPTTGEFVSKLLRHIEASGTRIGGGVLREVERSALSYVAVKFLSKKDLTVSGLKKIMSENKKLADECGGQNVDFGISISLLSTLYSLHLPFMESINLVDICSILNGHQAPIERIYEVGYLIYRVFHDQPDLLAGYILNVKDSLESIYKGLTGQFSDYLIEHDKESLKAIAPMTTETKVEDIIVPTSEEEVIRTSDRYIEGKIPIPQIPGPPSRRGAGGIQERAVPISTAEIFRPTTSTDYFFKKSPYPPHPENLPEKLTGREFVKSLKVHRGPRDYETQFAFGSSDFTSPRLTYFKRMSEREYAYNMKMKQLKEEQSRLEKKRQQKITRRYKDLDGAGEGSISLEESSASELPDISEEPSPLPSVEEPVQAPSKLGLKFHTLVPKTSKIYTQPSRLGRFDRDHRITYSTLKPVRVHTDSYSPKETSEESLESSEGTIGLPSREQRSPVDSRVSSPEMDISSGAPDISITPPSPGKSTPLTTEAFIKDLSVKCPDLTRSQKRRALGLFRVTKYLYKGDTHGWYTAAFCRAVHFAERDVCVQKGVKSLNIKKMASECFSAIRGSPFVKNNPELLQLVRQVCYSYYKRRSASVCIE
ncbi:arabinogalactan protein [Cryptosporidium felis]|nr:arabinogalactan protein [Cryptosporidium felis]